MQKFCGGANSVGNVGGKNSKTLGAGGDGWKLAEDETQLRIVAG